MIARIVLFSAYWNIVWCIKTNFLFKYCMQWLQEYYFLDVGTFCDESKHILLWSDQCSNITRLLFSTWWNILWCIKTNILLKYFMQWLQEYCFPPVGTFSDESKRIFISSIVCNAYKNTISCMLEHCVMHQNKFSF